MMSARNVLHGMAGCGAPRLRAGVVVSAMALCAWSTTATAQDLAWVGWETDDGGRVVWGIPESDAFVSFTCSRGGSVEFWNDGALPGDFLKNPVIRVKVDGREFSFRADAQFNEMNDAYEATAVLSGNDPFLKAVASGTGMQIYDLTTNQYSPNTISLKGTGPLFAQYLSSCLVE